MIIAALIAWISGGDPMSVLTQNAGALMGGGEQTTQQYTPTAEDQELEAFVSQILAGTEDVWTEVFRQQGLTYEPPKLVLFNGSVQSGCGGATSAVGPFYCSATDATLLPTRWDIMCRISWGFSRTPMKKCRV